MSFIVFPTFIATVVLAFGVMMLLIPPDFRRKKALPVLLIAIALGTVIAGLAARVPIEIPVPIDSLQDKSKPFIGDGDRP
jgi:hypothetical protein